MNNFNHSKQTQQNQRESGINDCDEFKKTSESKSKLALKSNEIEYSKMAIKQPLKLSTRDSLTNYDSMASIKTSDDHVSIDKPMIHDHDQDK